MIIKQIVITNYQSYYGESIFNFVEGLNIIHGANGHGKTKFFEAIEWLFKDTDKDSNTYLESLLSKKAVFNNLENGENVKVSVRLRVSQNKEIKTIEKSFIARKIENEIDISKPFLKGIREKEMGERYGVDSPKDLRKEIFSNSIIKYSMFKGETDLKVFQNKEALSILIGVFSDTEHLKKYIPKAEYFVGRADDAVSKDVRKKTRDERIYMDLSHKISRCKKRITDKEIEKEQCELNIEKNKNSIDSYENIIDNADAYQTHTKRIDKKEEEINKLKANVLEKEKYTQDLFDENWILVNYKPIFEEYKIKVADISKNKRKLENEYQQKIGEKKAIENLKNNIIPLPVGAPTRLHMEEMLADELCKVCNREAKKDSEAYQFMNNRLKEYIESVEKNKTEKKYLFKSNFINSLTKISDAQDENIAKIIKMEAVISENFKFVDARKKDIIKKIKEKEKEEEEIAKIIGDSGLNAESSATIWQNFKGLSSNNEDEKELLRKIEETLKIENIKLIKLQEEKDEIDTKNVSGYLMQTSNLLKDILKITTQTTEREFNSLVIYLENQANEIYQLTNKDGFTGKIKLLKSKIGNQNQVEFKVVDNFNKSFDMSGSQEVLAHTSLLLAISKMVKKEANESYPLILDAPLSTFDRNKYSLFFNSFKENTEQAIIVIKDFIIEDENKKISIDKSFYSEDIHKDKSFWVKLDENSNINEIETINSVVIEL
ncbi:AAA family ATPase [Tenacibaculum piscium]|uniref:AAA family ATPase n=1 Tax=Tenacibaculum piscium TaxID=1458515 RepID=UPI00187B7414|nr:AAA family ATPase [Tenacibaculum piscium]MBE7689478.1 AAA family ATPase [Tenacibaculum piscium]